MAARIVGRLAILVLACSPRSSPPDACPASSSEVYPPPGRQRLRGFYVTGNELHAFQLCGQSGLTWVELQGGETGLDKLAAVPRCHLPDGGPDGCTFFPYIEMDATVSGPCGWGHAGKFDRKLDIHEVLLVSKTAPPDCPHVEPHYPQ